MTEAEVITWLYRTKNICVEINVDKEELERIEAPAISTTAKLTGMPGSVSKDPHYKIENAALRAADLRAHLEQLEGILHDTESKINQMPNANYRTLLKMRHVQNKRWSVVEDEMHISPTWRKRLYKRAVKQLKTILKE